MKEFHASSWLVGLVLIAIGFCFEGTLGALNSYAGETEKYHGQVLSDAHPQGYDAGSGQCLSSTSVGANDCFLGLTGSIFITSNGRKIGVIWLQSNTRNRDAKGHTIWRVDDTLEYPADYRGTFDIEGCTSSAYPDAKIIAKGQWREREPPQVGGLLRTIEKAWRVDFETRKFVEISINGVVCELNEDRD